LLQRRTPHAVLPWSSFLYPARYVFSAHRTPAPGFPSSTHNRLPLFRRTVRGAFSSGRLRLFEISPLRFCLPPFLGSLLHRKPHPMSLALGMRISSFLRLAPVLRPSHTLSFYVPLDKSYVLQIFFFLLPFFDFDVNIIFFVVAVLIRAFPPPYPLPYPHFKRFPSSFCKYGPTLHLVRLRFESEPFYFLGWPRSRIGSGLSPSVIL